MLLILTSIRHWHFCCEKGLIPVVKLISSISRVEAKEPFSRDKKIKADLNEMQNSSLSRG